jgi:hypothetical protein
LGEEEGLAVFWAKRDTEQESRRIAIKNDFFIQLIFGNPTKLG